MIAAMLAVRAQEMRLVARAVGEVAVRLAEPESFSTDAVLTMSQTVRREVAAVGDGVERALARAGELETLVRGEIATLERAYSDNEIRIRSLVDELVAQREAIVTNADRVRTAITGSHQSLSQELEGASDRIVSAVTGAGERVTGALETRGAAITASLGEAGDRVVGLMTARGSDLIDNLDGHQPGRARHPPGGRRDPDPRLREPRRRGDRRLRGRGHRPGRPPAENAGTLARSSRRPAPRGRGAGASGRSGARELRALGDRA